MKKGDKMSLGLPIKKDNYYYFDVLSNNFKICNKNNHFIVMKQTSTGVISVMKKCKSLKESIEFLVNWINKNMSVTYPNLTL